MVMAWKRSALGARRFCREQGLAVSTFGLWRKKLAGETTARTSPLAVTPDATFVVAREDGEPEPVVTQPSTTADTSSSRDRVTLSLAGARIELTGVHAERIVRFVLGQLGGARC
jgi:hypothetical protein